MNGVRWPRWRGPPLALQIMALLVGGLVVAQLVTLMLTLLLPPAPAAQYGLDDIAAALVDEPRRGSARRRPAADRAAWPARRERIGLACVRTIAQRTRQADRGRSPARILAFYTPLPFAGTAAARSMAMAAPDRHYGDGR
jgi:two-component system OmpR family sensor kinase